MSNYQFGDVITAPVEGAPLPEEPDYGLWLLTTPDEHGVNNMGFAWWKVADSKPPGRWHWRYTDPARDAKYPTEPASRFKEDFLHTWPELVQWSRTWEAPFTVSAEYRQREDPIMPDHEALASMRAMSDRELAADLHADGHIPDDYQGEDTLGRVRGNPHFGHACTDGVGDAAPSGDPLTSIADKIRETGGADVTLTLKDGVWTAALDAGDAGGTGDPQPSPEAAINSLVEKL